LTVREIYSSAATLIELYYCSQEEYTTISVICFLWWLISGECFTHWNSVHRDRIRTTTTTANCRTGTTRTVAV